MRCPQCGSTARQGVKETRTSGDGRIVRRRACPDCGHNFHTVEQVSEAGLQVRKADGRVVPFVGDSIRTNIRKASARRLTVAQIDDLVTAIISDLHRRADGGPIQTSQIAEAVLEHLRTVDPATHVRFALVHAGRQDRDDTRAGWRGLNEVRAWLISQYPALAAVSSPDGLAKVVKRDGRVVEFDRGKLERGIGIASKGRGSRERVHRLAEDVAEDVQRELGWQPVVTSGQIAAEILRSLRRRDSVAYLRMAGSLKRFSGPEDYYAEAEALAAASPSAAASPVPGLK